jgi:hypothetical protein
LRYSQARASATNTVGISVPIFKNCQPWVVTRAPELKELIAIVPNTQKLIVASVLFFSLLKIVYFSISTLMY